MMHYSKLCLILQQINNFLLTAGIFIGLVLAIGFAVAEEFFVDAFTISARQFAFWADWLISPEDGHDLTWF